jgi:hypothetical protein
MNHDFWYLSRAAGFTAYLLLFASVALGIATSTRLGRRFMAQNATFDIHRFLSILALGFTVFHVYILLGDGYFNYNFIQLTAPFMSPYRTWSVAVGTFSLYALVLIVASFYVRKWIGYRSWRALHFVTFALYAGATLHGIVAGTDTSQPWARGIYLLTGGIVLGLLAYRLQHRIPRDIVAQRIRFASAGLAIVTAIVLTFGTGLLSGSGNGSGSVAGDANVSNGGQSVDQSGSNNAFAFIPSFDSQVTGTYQQTGGQTSSELVMDGTTNGGISAHLTIDLAQEVRVPPTDNESAESHADNEEVEQQPVQTVTKNTVQLTDPQTNAVVCTGQLTSFDRGNAVMTCQGTGALNGVSITMQGQFRGDDGRFSGALSGNMTRG